MDWKDLVPYILSFLIGWFIKSPLGKYVPSKVAEVVAKLDAADIDRVIGALSSKEARRDTAVALVVQIATRKGVPVSHELAGKVVDYLSNLYHKEITERLD